MKTLLHKPLCYLFHAVTYMLRSGGTWQTCFFVLAAGFNRFIRYRPVENLKNYLEKPPQRARGRWWARATRPPPAARRARAPRAASHAMPSPMLRRPQSTGHEARPSATEKGKLLLEQFLGWPRGSAPKRKEMDFLHVKIHVEKKMLLLNRMGTHAIIDRGLLWRTR